MLTKTVSIKTQEIGGSKGDSFELDYGNQGHFVKQLKVWQGDWQLRGIQLTFSNDETKMYGSQSGIRADFDLSWDERITSLRIWSNDANTDDPQCRCGAFQITTNKNREFYPKLRNGKLRKGDAQEVGSGYLCGIKGKAGSDIDRLGFIFLKPIEDSVLKELTYLNLNSALVATTPVVLDKLTIDNRKGSQPQESTISGRRELESSNNWSSSNKIEISTAFKVEAGIPKILDVAETTTLSLSQESTYSLSKSDKEIRESSHKLICGPGRYLEATLVTYQDRITLNYTGKIEIKFKDGDTLSYPVQGVYTGASARSIYLIINRDDANANEANSKSLVIN
jgi:hypothetical protein